MTVELIVAGERISALGPWGDLEWATCWPGGTETISFDVARRTSIYRPGALVELDYGGIRIGVATLVEPTRGELLMAEGLHRQGEDFAALDVSNNASVDTDDAINRARVRGLPWAAQAPIPPADPLLDGEGVRSVAQLLDHKAKTVGQQWGVGVDRVPFLAGWEPATLHMLPGVDGLSISRDGYASRLIARYLNVTTGTYWTEIATDWEAVARWDNGVPVEHTITEPLAEGAPMTPAQAVELLAGVLAQGRSQMGWTAPLEVQAGDVVTEYGEPVDLNRIYARQSIRLHGLDLDASDLSGQTWVDMRIARTRHKGSTVVIEPLGLSSPMADALAGLSA